MLRPFFSYFGSKYRLAKLYPEPQHSIVVEPFAGSAGYALLHHAGRCVKLFDTFTPVIDTWNYLINVSEKEFLELPLTSKSGHAFDKNHTVDEYDDLEPGAKALIGFWLTESQTHASRYPLSRSRGGNWTQIKKEKLCEQLKYIRGWVAAVGSYEHVPNETATWFVDPPYQHAGKRYRHNRIDYSQLGFWCESREGQTIVCEQEPADWLPFQYLKAARNASNNSYTEILWENRKCNTRQDQSGWTMEPRQDRCLWAPGRQLLRS